MVNMMTITISMIRSTSRVLLERSGRVSMEKVTIDKSISACINQSNVWPALVSFLSTIVFMSIDGFYALKGRTDTERPAKDPHGGDNCNP